MATWIAFALGSASTALLFLMFVTIDTAASAPPPSVPTPGTQLGGGFSYPLYNNKGVIQVLNETFVGRTLPFTFEVPQLGSAAAPVEGTLLALARPADADDNSDSAADAARACSMPEISLADSIVLVRAGGCSVVVKLLNCEAVGARAVIIESASEHGDELHLATARIPGLAMPPATFRTLEAAAGELASLWSLPHGLDLSTADVLILLVVRPVMLFLIITIILAVNLGCAEPRRTAPQRVVAALPTRVWPGAAHRGIWNQDGCRICLEDFADGCEVMTLPCGHEFHSACVSAWLLKQREVCPLCKMGVDRERIPLLV